MTRIAVTGATGFLGSHLVDALVEQDHEVLGIGNLHRGRLATIQRHIVASVEKMRTLLHVEPPADPLDGLEAMVSASAGETPAG